MAQKLMEADFAAAVAESEKLSLVDFYTDSCTPCKRLAPVLGEFEDEYAGVVAVYKVNAAQETALVNQYGIMSTPTLVLFRGGTELDRKVGVQTKDALLAWVQSF